MGASAPTHLLTMEKYQIKLTQNLPALKKGQELLVEYLQKCFGKDVVSNDALKAFYLSLLSKEPQFKDKGIKKNDGFIISQKNGDIFLVGSTPRGVIYSVITFLEDYLGICFFTYDDEYCPSLKEMPLIKEKVYCPVFDMRTYLVGGNYDDKWDEGYSSPKLDELVKTHTLDVFTKMDDEHGGPSPVYGRNITHNFHFYCPYEKYGESHPEFFKEITVNGQKMHTIDITNGINSDGSLNESKEISVVKIVIEEMKKDVKSHPEASVFSLTQEDGGEYYIGSNGESLLKKYKHSGLLIRFCNLVTRVIHSYAEKELGRDVKLVTFAYDYAIDAPVTKQDGKLVPIDSSVIVDKNLIIQLALFRNGFYSYFSPKQNPKIHKIMTEWPVVAKNYWFWGYDIDFANYFSFYDSFHNIKENVIGFMKYGIKYICINGPYDEMNNWECNIRAYMYHRLMWNPTLDDESLYKSYLNHYYGLASNNVDEMISLFHKHFEGIAKTDSDFFISTWGSQNYAKNCPKEMVLKSLSILEEGVKKINESSLSIEEKKIFVTRLKAVETTPLNLLYLNFKYYYPNGTEEERIKAKNNLLKAVEDGHVDKARERFTIMDYVDFVESDEYKKRPMSPNKGCNC